MRGLKLKMFTSRYPQTDGSAEILNRILENYLFCYCVRRQRNWDHLLFSEEFVYNSATAEAKKLSFSEMDLSWLPRSPLIFLSNQVETNIQSATNFKNRLQSFFWMPSFLISSHKHDSQLIVDIVTVFRRIFLVTSIWVDNYPLIQFWKTGLSKKLSELK